jgi:hypothetical protein
MDKYVPLKECVAMFLDANGKSMKDFRRCWVIAFRALRALNQSIAAEPKSIRIPVDANKTVPLPDDYLAWNKIGVLNDKGEVCSLKINNALTIYRDANGFRLDRIVGNVNADTVNISEGLYHNFCDNGKMFNLFGVGGGLLTYGDCRVDEKAGVILLHPDFQYADIILEYISSPERDGDYYVESCLQEAIIAFIEWKLKLGTEQAFYARAIEGRRGLSNARVTLQRIHEVLRETGGQYLKA